MVETGLYAGDLEGGKLVADTEHLIPACKNSMVMRKFLNFQKFPSCESYIGFLAKSVKTIISINSIDFSDGARS